MTNKYWHELDPFNHHCYRFEFIYGALSWLTDRLFGRKIKVYIRSKDRTWRRITPWVMKHGSWVKMTRRELDDFIRKTYHK